MRILIVDDETAVFEHLKALIPWEELGWTIIGHALNGEEACKLVRFYQPQLILTDIRMPIMDGLQFMDWLKQSGAASEVIVLSGYGDFEYSRTAFLHGAFDYVLKPVQKAELLQVLSKVVEKIHLNSAVKTDQIRQKAVISSGLSVLQDELFTHVVGAGEADEHELIVRSEQLQIRLPEEGYYFVVMRIVNQEEKVNTRYKGDRGVFHFAVRNIMRETIEHSEKLIIYRQLTKTNELAVIYPSHDKQDKRLASLLSKTLHSLQQFVQVSAKIGVSLHKKRLSKFAAAYREASQALDSMPLDDKESIAYYGASMAPETRINGSKDFTNTWKDIGILVDTLLETGILRDGSLLITKLNEAFEEEALAGMRGRDLKQLASMILEKIEAKSQKDDIILLVNEGKSRLQEMNIPQIKELLLQIFEHLLAVSSGELKLKNGKQLIEVICRFIEDNYRTVALDEISQKFYLNKNYFCTLFKQVTGTSFMEYVTAIRIHHAKRLLKESGLKTYEIAEQVGYVDQRYFSQVFKKIVGMQPTQYRQSVHHHS